MLDSKANDTSTKDVLELGGKSYSQRLLIGTALYPSPSIMQSAISKSSAEIATVSLRRQQGSKPGDYEAGSDFWELLKATGVDLLPNTAGCHSVKEAITTAQMAREVFKTNWIKLEVIGNDYNLQPDPFGLLEASEELIRQGFEVFPYCTDDLVLCEKLVNLGCKILMPWGAPIGTGRGLINPYALSVIRNRFPELTLIVDAGIGKPSHAVQAMELGYDAVLLNTAIANALDPVKMAAAFRDAVKAGRTGFLAGAMQERSLASPSTPETGKPFWHQQ